MTYILFNLWVFYYLAYNYSTCFVLCFLICHSVPGSYQSWNVRLIVARFIAIPYSINSLSTISCCVNRWLISLYFHRMVSIHIQDNDLFPVFCQFIPFSSFRSQSQAYSLNTKLNVSWISSSNNKLTSAIEIWLFHSKCVLCTLKQEKQGVPLYSLKINRLLYRRAPGWVSRRLRNCQISFSPGPSSQDPWLFMW